VTAVSPAVDVSSPPKDAAAEEAALMARVFRALRTEHNAAAALAALEEHDRRFPTGALGHEARVARTEALVALGKGAEALVLVDGYESASLPRSLRLARAEWRSAGERCAEAVMDFDAVLARGADDSLGERALYGRASCGLAQGDTVRARSDLERLLATHPNGRFSADARHALARLTNVRSSTP